MNYTFLMLLRFTKIVPAVVAFINRKKIDPLFVPFLWLIWMGLLNESVSEVCNRTIRTNAINSNIYVLIDAFIILWQFDKWKLFSGFKQMPYLTALLLTIVWVLDMLVFHQLNVFTSYFRIVYSFITVLLSISMMNTMIANERGNLLRNAVFLICVTFIIFYTYKMLVELFWVNGLYDDHGKGSSFRYHVSNIFRYVNVFCNFAYALIFLWIPKKQVYTMQF